MLAPLTGVAGFLGQEQLSWAKYAVKTLPSTMGLKVKLVPGDLPVEKGQADAQAVAQKFIADKSMVAVVGGSTSGSVVSTSTALTQAGLVQVSPSATRSSISNICPGAVSVAVTSWIDGVAMTVTPPARRPA